MTTVESLARTLEIVQDERDELGRLLRATIAERDMVRATIYTECIALAEQMMSAYRDDSASELDAGYAMSAGIEALKADGLEEYIEKLREVSATVIEKGQ